MDERILDIQQRLSDLRQDRSRFFTVHNVTELYTEFKEVLESLSSDQLTQSQPIIRDCLLIFSLAYNTVGLTRQPIAVYAKAISLSALFQFIRWDPAFTPKEFNMLTSSLESIGDSLTLADETEIPVIPYVDQVIKDLYIDLKHPFELARHVINSLPDAEYPVFSQVIHMRRYILAQLISSQYDPAQHAALKTKLDKVWAHISVYADPEEGHSDEGPTKVAIHGSALLQHQLHKACFFIDLFKDGVSLEEMDKEDPALRPIYEKLTEMLPVLDVFVMTRRWTLRVTDLYQQMKTLLKIQSELMISRDVPDYSADVAVPSPVDKSLLYRYLITYLARRAWALMFKLLDTVEPVSEALQSLYNQLMTMKRCLVEVRTAGGISNLRELYPYQLKLVSLDNLRVEGKFVVDGEVPPGQGVLNSLLAECFDIVFELKIELEEKGEEPDESRGEEDDLCSSSSFDSDCDSEVEGKPERPMETLSVVSSVNDHTADHLADVPDANE